MRSGTSSMSVKPQTSFCNATQARISSRPWHLRTRIEPGFTGRSIPAVLPVAIGIPDPAWEPAAECGPRRAAVVPSIENDDGTCDWFFVAPILSRAKGSAQCSPAQRRDRQLRPPGAGGDLRKYGVGPIPPRRGPEVADRAREILSDVPEVLRSLRAAFRIGLRHWASRSRRSRRAN